MEGSKEGTTCAESRHVTDAIGGEIGLLKEESRDLELSELQILRRCDPEHLVKCLYEAAVRKAEDSRELRDAGRRLRLEASEEVLFNSRQRPRRQPMRPPAELLRFVGARSEDVIPTHGRLLPLGSAR